MVEKPIIPKPKLILPHASAGDWDFSDPAWKITTLQYVSPPSCLQIGTTASPISCFLLCKNAAVLKLPQGRLVSFIRPANLSHAHLFQFRNTAAPGASDQKNCYYAWLVHTSTSWTLYEMLNDAIQRVFIGTKTTWAHSTWHRIRISWWLSWDTLIVALEREINGVWTMEGDVLTIPNPLHGDATYQRVGLGASNSNQDYPNFQDDTEIWEYIP